MDNERKSAHRAINTYIHVTIEAVVAPPKYLIVRVFLELASRRVRRTSDLLDTARVCGQGDGGRLLIVKPTTLTSKKREMAGHGLLAGVYSSSMCKRRFDENAMKTHRKRVELL